MRGRARLAWVLGAKVKAPWSSMVWEKVEVAPWTLEIRPHVPLPSHHGAFTFTPSAHANRALPREAPAPVAALLQHDQLYT